MKRAGNLCYQLFLYIYRMNLMMQAKQDIERILSATNEFAMNVTFRAPTGETLETTAQFFDRTAVFTSEDQSISSRHIVLHVSEKPFTDAEYPMRIADKTISFNNHIVTATYADGRTETYKVFDTNPDYSINMITIQMQTYAGN